MQNIFKYFKYCTGFSIILYIA